ncbi:conserved hypothetical protein [Ricinus communis]|uniref:Uncharacterized protein n=1 Tax=Ricinus communis TaxID=3988 RepID=B9RWC9_RICCO|nr:conserved hypothetical protein [Ricinus communis]
MFLLVTRCKEVCIKGFLVSSFWVSKLMMQEEKDQDGNKQKCVVRFGVSLA